MRKMQALVRGALLLCGGLAAAARGASAAEPMAGSRAAAVEREVREFYGAYAADLQHHRREAIAGRYDPRGVFFLGDGRKELVAFEALKKQYLTEWEGPKSFGWRDLSVDVLSPDAAVVVGRFEWQAEAGESLAFSYTGVLVRHPGGWRIRVEDESR